MFAKEKHSSLFQTFINYGNKKFYNIGTWANGIKINAIIYKFSHLASVFVRLGWKRLPMTNTLAYFKNKKFYKIGPCSNGDGDKLRLLLKVGIGLMSMLLFNL
jgi:hypothetical protein